ncbi:hypothetical protein [Saezia sanguinis]|uniref:hypothetical protein n=1 Tax=Saezia sanguinis TaxID=1965230 RepID=UPI0013A68648|nr:hypothetical protein [Saezia sanguinis]
MIFLNSWLSGVSFCLSDAEIQGSFSMPELLVPTAQWQLEMIDRFSLPWQQEYD